MIPQDATVQAVGHSLGYQLNTVLAAERPGLIAGNIGYQGFGINRDATGLNPTAEGQRAYRQSLGQLLAGFPPGISANVITGRDIVPNLFHQMGRKILLPPFDEPVVSIAPNQLMPGHSIINTIKDLEAAVHANANPLQGDFGAKDADDDRRDGPLPLKLNIEDTDNSETLSVSAPRTDTAGTDYTLPKSKRLQMDAESLIASDDYYDDPRKQARVAAIFRELYPPVPVPDPRGEEDRDPAMPRGIGRSGGARTPSTFDFGFRPVKMIEPRPFEDPPNVDWYGTGAAGAEDLLAEADDLIASDDYYDDPRKQRRVAAIFKTLYPGTVRTAPLNFGEGL